MNFDEPINSPQELVDAVLRCQRNSLPSGPVPRQLEESVFIPMGDCWVICYRGQAAIFKTTRGLAYLAYLLRHPRREVHVRQLVGSGIDHATLALRGSSRTDGSVPSVAPLQNALPTLDSQAKLEYKRRIDELRKDVEEAERFHDSYRASMSRRELEAIAQRLTAAIGLGGRDRPASSDAERARSACTKRIKEAINRIAKVLPSLGLHLAARIKTGYFCSYNPHPDRPVSWKLLMPRKLTLE
jgi:hypothetical protein